MTAKSRAWLRVVQLPCNYRLPLPRVSAGHALQSPSPAWPGSPASRRRWWLKAWDGASARIGTRCRPARRAQAPLRRLDCAGEAEPVAAVLDQEQAVDGLDLVRLGVVIGEPLQGIGRAAWTPQQVTWPVGALEPGVVFEQIRVVGVGEDDDACGVPPVDSGARLPVTERVTQVSVQASRTGYRLTVVPEGAPHSWRMMWRRRRWRAPRGLAPPGGRRDERPCRGTACGCVAHPVTLSGEQPFRARPFKEAGHAPGELEPVAPAAQLDFPVLRPPSAPRIP